MTRRWAVWALLLSALVSVSCGRNTGSVSVLNKAEEPIVKAKLATSWGETVEVTDVGTSEAKTLNYRVSKEGDYRVDVVFRSGKRLTTDTVYVTPGFDYQDRIIVTPSEIQVSHAPVTAK